MEFGLLLRNGVQDKGYHLRIQDYDINMSVFNYAEFLQCYSKLFIFKYFIPWCALTTKTSISSFIPPNVIPGRGEMFLPKYFPTHNIHGLDNPVNHQPF